MENYTDFMLNKIPKLLVYHGMFQNKIFTKEFSFCELYAY